MTLPPLSETAMTRTAPAPWPSPRLPLPVAQGSDEPKVLNVYNWSDYIAEDTLKNFEKETGIKVRYDNYDNNEILHAKLVAGKTGYDIVVPAPTSPRRRSKAACTRSWTAPSCSNWGNLDPAVLEQMAKVDPGNQHLVNWLWGYVTVGINTGKVKAALGARRCRPTPGR
jgi:putrescine transport system substrate-binding protein